MVQINRELHASASARSCKHVEFDITGSRLRYEAGDHAGIFPINDEALVSKIQVNLLATYLYQHAPTNPLSENGRTLVLAVMIAQSAVCSFVRHQ